MNLLFVTHSYPNYVPDLLLHGLRKRFGPAVVDFPRKNCLYDGVLGVGVCPEEECCPHWFPSDEGQVDRSDIWSKLSADYYSLVVCDLRALPFLSEHVKHWPRRLVLIDGEDHPQRIPPGPYVICRRETDGTDFSIPLPMALPQEVFDVISSHDHEPKLFTFGFLGSANDCLRKQMVEALSRFYPQSLLKTTDIASEDAPTPAGRLGRIEYYRQLQRCRVVLSLAGTGFDTFRYWENAAFNAVHAVHRLPFFIPENFKDGHSILRFENIDELRRKIDVLLEDEGRSRELISQSRKHLLAKHLTIHRADYFLERVRSAFRPFHTRYLQLWRMIDPANKVSAKVQNRVDSPIHLGLVQGDGYGWGVCSRYLIKELSKERPVLVLNPEDGSSENPSLPGAMFQALTNVDFDPMFPKARAERNFGYTFFENELTERSRNWAKHFDKVLGGSSWCIERMHAHGITNCDVLIQGIDPEIFYPIDDPPDPERFVIFSGGKFELRKGQDLVLRAVKIMQDKYPDVWLVNCWYNFWPASTRLMSYSSHIRFEHRNEEPWTATMARTYADNGLDSGRIVTCELMPQNLQRDLYSRTDIGLFPNRCEGGTNLVLMEYMACARPVIASDTSGHRDIVNKNNALLLNQLSPFNVTDAKGELIARWQEPSLDEIVAQLEFAYHHRRHIRQIGLQAGSDLKQFTWALSARRLLEIMEG